MNENIKITKIKLSNYFNIIAIFIMLYACYFNAIKTISISYVATILIALIFLIISYLLNNDKKIAIYFPSLVIFFVVLYSKLFTINENTTNRYLTMYLIYMLISFFILKIDNWKKYLQSLSLLFSFITVIVTILTWISPGWYIDNILPNLYFESQNTMYNLIEYAKSYPGIFASTGLNAFFISVGIAILFSRIIINKKSRKLNVILILVYTFALLLTLKRATLVLNVIAILVILLFNNANAKRKIKILIISIILMCIAYCVFPEIFNNTLSRFQADSTEELLNGRVELYDFAKKSIENNVFYGYGFGCFSKAYAKYNTYNGIPLDTHNEILQVASETGILGVLLVFIPMIYMYIKSIKKFRLSKENNEKLSMSISLYIQSYFLVYLLIGNPLHDTSIYLVYLLYTLSSVNREEKINGEESFNNNTSI